MNFIEKIFGGATSAPIEAIGKIVDDIHTSELEQLDAEIKLREVSNNLIRLQAEITKQEAAHRSVFVAGWRPFIGWSCGFIFAFHYLVKPIVGLEVETPSPEHIENILYAMMGVAGLRTIEKAKGLTR